MASHRSSSSTPWSPATRWRRSPAGSASPSTCSWPTTSGRRASRIPSTPTTRSGSHPTPRSRALPTRRTTRPTTPATDDRHGLDRCRYGIDGRAALAAAVKTARRVSTRSTAGDTTRLKVAEKFDVTVEALDAANCRHRRVQLVLPWPQDRHPLRRPEPDEAHAPQPLPITCVKPSPSNSNTATPAPS